MNDQEINEFLDKVEHIIDLYNQRYAMQGNSSDMDKITFVKLVLDEERYQASQVPEEPA